MEIGCGEALNRSKDLRKIRCSIRISLSPGRGAETAERSQHLDLYRVEDETGELVLQERTEREDLKLSYRLHWPASSLEGLVACVSGTAAVEECVIRMSRNKAVGDQCDSLAMPQQEREEEEATADVNYRAWNETGWDLEEGTKG